MQNRSINKLINRCNKLKIASEKKQKTDDIAIRKILKYNYVKEDHDKKISKIYTKIL